MNRLINWDPFKEMNQISNLLRHSSARGGGSPLETVGDWAPAVDISEDETGFTITADLPDVSRDDVKVSVENGSLTISGERRHESEDEDTGKKFHRIERSYGSYSRSFAVPDNVDSGNITASFRDGVLNVTLPKVELEDRPGKIDVNVD